METLTIIGLFIIVLILGLCGIILNLKWMLHENNKIKGKDILNAFEKQDNQNKRR